jgi:hypothetical protein
MTHTPIPVLAQGSRAELMAKLTEHDEALNALEPTNNLVFDPASVPGENVYNDWSKLVTAAQARPGWKVIQFVGSCTIPGGTWDMGGPAHWWGFNFATVDFGDNANPANDAVFLNWFGMDGDIQVNNNNVATAPWSAVGDFSVFSLGTQMFGNPVPNNIGSAPFFDASNMNAFGFMGIRNGNTIQGTTPAIKLGDNSHFLYTDILDGCTLKSGMVVGGASDFIYPIFLTSSARLMQQPGFLGTVMNGNPTANTTLAWERLYVTPPAGTPASTVPITGQDLGYQSLYRFDTTAGDITQVLPLMKDPAPPISSDADVPGAMVSIGMKVIVKNQVGANNVILQGAAGATIDGLATISVPPGQARTLYADGETDWIVV